MDSPISPKQEIFKFASEADSLALYRERRVGCVRLMLCVEGAPFLYSLANRLLQIKSISLRRSTPSFTEEQCQIVPLAALGAPFDSNHLKAQES